MWWWVFLVWCSPNEHLFVSVVISELFFNFLRYRVKHDGPTSFMFTLILFLFISQLLFLSFISVCFTPMQLCSKTEEKTCWKNETLLKPKLLIEQILGT